MSTTWERDLDGAVFGYLDNGYEVEVSELDNAARAAKWGERYVPGRDWVVFDPDSQIVARGHSADLRAAKRAALAAIDALTREDTHA